MIGGHEVHRITGSSRILNPSPLAVKYLAAPPRPDAVGELFLFATVTL